MLDYELRTRGIGGSEIASVMRWDTDRDAFDLWQEKKGYREKREPTYRMALGKCLEKGIVQFYEYITKKPTTWVDTTAVHPHRPYQVFTPDAVCVLERRGVDAKLVSWDQRHRWGPTPDDIPYRARLQAHWYMSAMDYDAWDIAALIGEALVIYSYDRDLDFERVLLAEAEEFYRRYIVGDETPPMLGTRATDEWIRKEFPRHSSRVRRATPEETEWLREYGILRAQYKDLGEDKKRMESRLKKACGTDEGLYWDGGRFTWRKIKDSLVTDWESLARKLLLQYTTADQTSWYLQQYSENKVGYRRIWYQSDYEIGEYQQQQPQQEEPA